MPRIPQGLRGWRAGVRGAFHDVQLERLPLDEADPKEARLTAVQLMRTAVVSVEQTADPLADTHLRKATHLFAKALGGVCPSPPMSPGTLAVPRSWLGS
jgi:hypothetical protein